MGAAQGLPTSSHDFHDLASRRRNNRQPFASAVASLREELPLQPGAPPLPPLSQPRPRVCIRKRPLFEREVEHDFDVITTDGDGDVWSSAADRPASRVWVSRTMLCANARHMYCEHHAFYCDGCFDELASSGEVYAGAVRPLVQDARGGTDAACLLFGQTGSGKTFTFYGLLDGVAADLAAAAGGDAAGSDAAGSDAAGGDAWWEPPTAREAGSTAAALRVSALEVDGQAVTDLLHASSPCVLRAGADGATHVAPAAAGGPAPHVDVASVDEAIGVVRDAAARRSTHATGVHDASSRTHAVYRLQLLRPDGSRHATLSLTDLAGSEWSRDQAAHGAPGSRFTSYLGDFC